MQKIVSEVKFKNLSGLQKVLKNFRNINMEKTLNLIKKTLNDYCNDVIEAKDSSVKGNIEKYKYEIKYKELVKTFHSNIGKTNKKCENPTDTVIKGLNNLKDSLSGQLQKFKGDYKFSAELNAIKFIRVAFNDKSENYITCLNDTSSKLKGNILDKYTKKLNELIELIEPIQKQVSSCESLETKLSYLEEAFKCNFSNWTSEDLKDLEEWKNIKKSLSGIIEEHINYIEANKNNMDIKSLQDGINDMGKKIVNLTHEVNKSDSDYKDGLVCITGGYIEKIDKKLQYITNINVKIVNSYYNKTQKFMFDIKDKIKGWENSKTKENLKNRLKEIESLLEVIGSLKSQVK